MLRLLWQPGRPGEARGRLPVLPDRRIPAPASRSRRRSESRSTADRASGATDGRARGRERATASRVCDDTGRPPQLIAGGRFRGGGPRHNGSRAVTRFVRAGASLAGRAQAETGGLSDEFILNKVRTENVNYGLTTPKSSTSFGRSFGDGSRGDAALEVTGRRAVGLRGRTKGRVSGCVAAGDSRLHGDWRGNEERRTARDRWGHDRVRGRRGSGPELFGFRRTSRRSSTRAFDVPGSNLCISRSGSSHTPARSTSLVIRVGRTATTAS